MVERRHAILIGSSQFWPGSGLGALRCPPYDVDGLRDVLTRTGGFTDPIVLKDAPHGEVLLTIERLFRKTTPDDLVLLYYSGHGKLDLNGRLYLATADTDTSTLLTTSVPTQSIRDIISDCLCTKVVLILDCCYSGAADAAYKSGGVDDQLKTLAPEGRGTYILSASTGYQVAKEHPGATFSVFTQHLIDGIRDGAKSDADGNVTVPELYRYVSDTMRGDAQTPMMSGHHVQGAIVIARRIPDAAAKRRTRRARVFVSCDDPAAPVVRDVLAALDPDCEFSVDAMMPVGATRAQWIEDRLRDSDALIVFLSERSGGSWKLRMELETAHRLAEAQGGRPVTLPVLVGPPQPLQSPISDYLNPIQWTTWTAPEDTPRLVAELREGIALGKTPRRIGSPGAHPARGTSRRPRGGTSPSA